jgi:hypothetical protein
MKLSYGIYKGDIKVDEKRTCYVCGVTYPLTSQYFKKTKNGLTQKCKACFYADIKKNNQKKQDNKERVCPTCGALKKGVDFPKGSGNRSCFECQPILIVSKPKRKPPALLSDEELERRYQRVLKDTKGNQGLKYTTTYNIGQNVRVIRKNQEDKYFVSQTVQGVIVSKTRDFIVVKQSNGVRECFRYIDIAVGDYEVKGV